MIERFDPLKGERLRVLDDEGRAAPDLDPGLPDAALRSLYERMVLTRAADAKALKLQRQGRLGTYAPSLGHEAARSAWPSAMTREDWFFPYFRDLGTYHHAGLSPGRLLPFLDGQRGRHAGARRIEHLPHRHSRRLPDPSGRRGRDRRQEPEARGRRRHHVRRRRDLRGRFPRGPQFRRRLPHAQRLRLLSTTSAPSPCRARARRPPRRSPRRPSPTASPASRSTATTPGRLAATREALATARGGGGPTLIEAYTYRMGDHTTSDDASRYRAKAEVAEWERRDPLARFRLYLGHKGLWDEAYEKEVQAAASDFVEKAVAEAEARPPASVEDVFAYTYAVMPPDLARRARRAQVVAAGGTPMIMTMVQAINQALAGEMERDDRVVVLGEDVGRDGGVFRVDGGALRQVRAGAGHGHAARRIGGDRGGHRHGRLRPPAGRRDPVHGLHLPGLQPDHLPRRPAEEPDAGPLHRVPLVIRTPYGAGVKALEHHSESTEALFCQIPGLTVVVPSTPVRRQGAPRRLDPQRRSGHLPRADQALPGRKAGGPRRAL